MAFEQMCRELTYSIGIEDRENDEFNAEMKYRGGEQWGSIFLNGEGSRTRLRIYSSTYHWEFDCDDFLAIVNRAKQHLLVLEGRVPPIKNP